MNNSAVASNLLWKALLYHMTKKPHSVDFEDEIASRVDAIAVVVNLACAEEVNLACVLLSALVSARPHTLHRVAPFT